MRIVRALQIRGQMTGQINSLFQMAMLWGDITAEELTKRLIEITHPKSPKSIPEWVRCYCQGVSDTLHNQLYQDHLEFCYTLEDGNRYSVRKESNRYYEKHAITPKELHDRSISSGHYWIKSGKPYFIRKVINK